MKIKDLLINQKSNNKIALIDEYNRTISYKKWYEEANSFSSFISENISCISKIVLMFLPNSIEYAIGYFGLSIGNRVILPINIQMRIPEIISILKHCNSNTIITNSEFFDFLVDNMKVYEKRLFVVNVNSYNYNVNEKEETVILESEKDLNDVAIMLHTSGTTNNPKTVMLTHENLITNIKSNVESLKLTQDDNTLIILPMCFGYCNTAQFLTHVYLGATIFIQKSLFTPKLFFQYVQDYEITNTTLVPPLLLTLLGYRYYDYYNYKSLRYICFGGGIMPTSELSKLIDLFNIIGFVQTYGQTECSPRVTALLPVDSKRKLGSVGTTIPNVRIEILRENNTIANKNEIGEIVVYGNNVMKGYYRNQEANSKVFYNKGIRTGDLGYFDDEKYLYLVGRKKNMIITGGINIYPEEVEQIILEYPEIKDVVVTGKEDKLLGEVLIATLVANKKIDKSLIIKHCKEYLPNYKIPKEFVQVENIEKTYNGKKKRY